MRFVAAPSSSFCNTCMGLQWQAELKLGCSTALGEVSCIHVWNILWYSWHRSRRHLEMEWIVYFPCCNETKLWFVVFWGVALGREESHFIFIPLLLLNFLHYAWLSMLAKCFCLKKMLDSSKYYLLTPLERQIDGFLSNEIRGVCHPNEC